MKKVVVLLLLMVSTTVLAEWNKVGQSANGVFYVDIQSIKKKGKKAKIWILSDYKSVHEYNGKRHLSSVERDEFDCSEDKFRVTDLYLYSDRPLLSLQSTQLPTFLTNHQIFHAFLH